MFFLILLILSIWFTATTITQTKVCDFYAGLWMVQQIFLFTIWILYREIRRYDPNGLTLARKSFIVEVMLILLFLIVSFLWFNFAILLPQFID